MLTTIADRATTVGRMERGLPAAGATVIVFARRPRAGAVKRRLGRSVGGARANRVYRALLNRSLAVASELAHVRRILLVAERGDRPWFSRNIGRKRWCIAVQEGDGLGERMLNAFNRYCDGQNPVVLIGSDIADCTAADLRRAVRALTSADVVIGPVADGGYWLIGMREPLAVLFAGIDWSEPTVFACTMDRVKRSKRSHRIVGRRNDIDRGRDLGILRRRSMRR